MKKILSLLMCYVFLQAETFALKGGPQTTSGGALLGLYAGTIYPDPNDPLNDLTKVQSNLGMFQLSVPITGPAKGTIAIFDFQYGEVFLGVINGVADPDSGVLTGIFSANALLAETRTESGVSRTVATLAGQLSLKSSRSQKGVTNQRISGTGSSSVSSFVTGVLASQYVGWAFDGWQQSVAEGTVAVFDVGSTFEPPAAQ